MELTVAEKLDLLLALQEVDSKRDELLKVRGSLPEEVRDLEDELAGFQTRISKFEGDIAELNADIAHQRAKYKEAGLQIKKLEDYQNNVRNMREFEVIKKEVESLQLDQQLAEKYMREAEAKIMLKQKDIEDVKARVDERDQDLANKRAELDNLIKESEEDEVKIMKERNTLIKKIDERLLFSYDRLRNNARNGLAVVKVKRDACGGCYNTVPPQRQADIREKKKIIVCEHCGRVLAAVESIAVQEAAPAPRGRAARAAAATA